MRTKTLYAYCRVSTVLQNEARQVEAMKKLGVKEKNIAIEKASGKDFERPVYKQLVKKMKRGDVLAIHSIDRLGRNYFDIIEQWRYLVKRRGIDIIVLDMPILNTHECNDLTRRFISELVLALLSYVAQRERESITTRCREGLEVAKANGVKLGRRPMPLPEGFLEVKELWEGKQISCREAGRRLGVSPQTFMSWCNLADA